MLLLITARPLIAQTLTEHLHDAGIFFYHTPPQTALFHFEKRDIGGVFLDCTSNLQAACELCRDLRRRAPEMPIGVLVSKTAIPDLPADLIIRDGNLDTICDGVFALCRMCGWNEQGLRIYSITIDASRNVHYMGYPLPLSPRETTILHCLLYRYPRLTSTDELMSLCFPEELFTIDTLFTHISVINHRAEKIDPRPLIINVYGKGYRLRDGL